MYYPLVTKSALQAEIEEKLLYLIQLWYDTFMMHEDEFKEIILLYKQLRKEGVIFPARDSNAKFMIKFKGEISPIFATMEENKLYEEPTKNFNKKSTTKTRDFIEQSYENSASHVDAHTSNKQKYSGQNYEEQQRIEQDYIQEEIDNFDHITAEHVKIVSKVDYNFKRKLYSSGGYYDACFTPKGAERGSCYGSYGRPGSLIKKVKEPLQ